MELEQRHEKKWLKFKSQRLRTAVNNNGVKNKDNKIFSNYTVENITSVEVVENQSKRKRPVEDKVQRKKTYPEILKTDRDKDDKLEQNRNEGAAEIVTNKRCLGVNFQVNESRVTNNRVQRKRLKIAKPKIVDPCELADTNNVSLTSEMVCDYKRGNFKAIISPPVFITSSVEAQKKMVETFNSQDKELLVLEDVFEDEDSLILQNVRISNKAIEKKEIREEVSKQNGGDINLSSIWSQVLQDDKDLNLKLTTSPPMLTMDSPSAMNHSDFHASELKDEIFNTQDKEFLSVLENLMDIDDPLHSQNKNINAKVTTEGRISVTFVQTLCLT